MRDRKGKQLIGLLICLVIGGAVLGLGISRGVFADIGSTFGSIRITVKNNTEYDMEVRECTIIGIEVGSTEPDPELTLFGIPMGATRQEIADVYGEPFSKTFDDENHLSNMVYQFGTDIHSNQVVMIIFRDKKAVAASYEDFSLVRR